MWILSHVLSLIDAAANDDWLDAPTSRRCRASSVLLSRRIFFLYLKVPSSQLLLLNSFFSTPSALNLSSLSPCRLAKMYQRPLRSVNANKMNALHTEHEDLPPLMNPSFKSANTRYLSSAGGRGSSAVESLRQKSTQEPYINSEDVSL